MNNINLQKYDDPVYKIFFKFIKTALDFSDEHIGDALYLIDRNKPEDVKATNIQYLLCINSFTHDTNDTKTIFRWAWAIEQIDKKNLSFALKIMDYGVNLSGKHNEPLKKMLLQSEIKIVNFYHYQIIIAICTFILNGRRIMAYEHPHGGFVSYAKL